MFKNVFFTIANLAPEKKKQKLHNLILVMVPTNQKDVNSDSNLSHKNLDLNPPGFNPANWIPPQQWSGVRTGGGGGGYHAWKANHIDGGRPKWHKVHGNMVSIKVQKEPKYFVIKP